MKRRQNARIFLSLWLVAAMIGACTPSPEMEQTLTIAKRIAVLVTADDSTDRLGADTERLSFDPSTAEPTPTPISPDMLEYYEVQPGDTLWGIYLRFGIPVETLQVVNELEDPDRLALGQRLLLSDQVTVSGAPLPTPTPTPSPCQEGCPYPEPACEIKGVLARLDGTPMYLLPGDLIYTGTVAEVWFCREEDAQREGWLRWTAFGPER